METSTMTISLRQRLIKTCKTQQEMADQSGVSQAAISKFLRGTSSVNLENFERLLTWVSKFEAMKGKL